MTKTVDDVRREPPSFWDIHREDPWSKLLIAARLKPETVESTTRQLARFAAKEIETLRNALHLLLDSFKEHHKIAAMNDDWNIALHITVGERRRAAAVLAQMDERYGH